MTIRKASMEDAPVPQIDFHSGDGGRPHLLLQPHYRSRNHTIAVSGEDNAVLGLKKAQ